MFKSVALSALSLVFFSVSAHADLVGIGCGENRGTSKGPADVSFESEDVMLQGYEFSLRLKGHAVESKAVFREDNDHWIYIVTRKAKAGATKTQQFYFKVRRGCQEEGDVGTVTVIELSKQNGRRKLAVLPCVCDSD